MPIKRIIRYPPEEIPTTCLGVPRRYHLLMVRCHAGQSDQRGAYAAGTGVSGPVPTGGQTGNQAYLIRWSKLFYQRKRLVKGGWCGHTRYSFRISDGTLTATLQIDDHWRRRADGWLQ